MKDNSVQLRFYETRLGNDNILRRQLDLSQAPVAVSKTGAKLIERFRRLNDWEFEEQSVFHSSYFRVPARKNNVKVVATIHDFTHDLFFKGPRVWLHNFAKSRTILESDALITPSENTKRDLLKFYPQLNEKIVHVIHNGVSEEFKPEADLAPDGLCLLYVGARDDYKNFRFAAQLAGMHKDCRLNIVGAKLTPSEKLYLDSQLKGRYTVHTNISTASLNTLYNQASCLLYPSSYEGFGIPLLEAMRAGCPFIALDGSSIPEVAGDAGYLLSSLDLEEANEALKAIVAAREVFIRKGLQQSLKFSWEKCYEETKKLYASLI
jgi:mannosyltransferase